MRRSVGTSKAIEGVGGWVGVEEKGRCRAEQGGGVEVGVSKWGGSQRSGKGRGRSLGVTKRG